MLNKQQGNMYPDIDKTRNFIGGQCPYKCGYCYVNALKRFPIIKKKYSGKPRLIEKEFKKSLGNGKYIFIGSCFDMWADDVPGQWITKVLEKCKKYNNKYLFQTKNPKRFWGFAPKFPKNSILGTTIETNRQELIKDISKAPTVQDRQHFIGHPLPTMISIEPILDFDLDIMVNWMKDIEPKFISIGADSKGHKLQEPSNQKIEALIKELRKFTEVKLKDNLKRLGVETNNG